MKKTTFKDRLIAAVLIFLIVAIPSTLVFLLTPNSSEIMVPGNTVMTVDGTKVSVGFFNYFYTAATSSDVLLQLEKEYENFDASKSFSDQIYDSESGMTWQEYFIEAAKEQLTQIVSLSNKGEAAGIELFEEQKEEIQSQLDNAAEKAVEYDVLTNDYISIVYGEFAGKATLKKVMEKSYIAQNYYEYISVVEKPSDEETESYLKENLENMHSVSFDYYAVEYTFDFDEQKKQAQEVLDKSKTPEEFDHAVAEAFPTYDSWGFPATESVKLTSLYKKDAGYLPEKVYDWVYGSERSVGEKALITVDDRQLIYMILMKEPARLDTEIKCSVREMLFDVDETEESKNAALHLSEEISERIKKSENPEYTFAVLADIYLKEFEEMAYSGGLVGNIAFGDSEENINSWIFDESRKNGDFISVSGENGYYSFFFSDRYESWRFEAEQELITERIKKDSQAQSIENGFAYEKYVLNRQTGSESDSAE